MVGKNLTEYHQINNLNYQLYLPNSTELNLMDGAAVKAFVNEIKPDMIIHCAGIVGGIQANMKIPFLFFHDNYEMGKNVVDAADSNGVPNLMNLGSSCMYPRNMDRPLVEEDILTGELEPTNEGYALAKIGVAKLCEYLSKEKGHNYKTIIPCNLYGRWDKFDPEKSHMIPAVIRKLHLARENGDKAIIWGDGSARREFMYAQDLADFIFRSLEKLETLGAYTNVGLGYDYSIKEYYEHTAEVVGYEGGFDFDLTKPAGMKRKLCSVERQTAMGWKPSHSLKEGLKKTYDFYLEKYGV